MAIEESTQVARREIIRELMKRVQNDLASTKMAAIDHGEGMRDAVRGSGDE